MKDRTSALLSALADLHETTTKRAEDDFPVFEMRARPMLERYERETAAAGLLDRATFVRAIALVFYVIERDSFWNIHHPDARSGHQLNLRFKPIEAGHRDVLVRRDHQGEITMPPHEAAGALFDFLARRSSDHDHEWLEPTSLGIVRCAIGDCAETRVVSPPGVVACDHPAETKREAMARSRELALSSVLHSVIGILTPDQLESEEGATALGTLLGVHDAATSAGWAPDSAIVELSARIAGGSGEPARTTLERDAARYTACGLRRVRRTCHNSDGINPARCADCPALGLP